MRFYTEQHQHYCGIDLHARTLYLCVLDAGGNVLLHKNLPCNRAPFLEAIEPFRDDPGLLDSEIAVVDCSFIDPGTRVAARLGGHPADLLVA